MKCTILLAFVAFTSATPFTGWGGAGIYPFGGMWGLGGYQTPNKEAAQQVAHQVTQEAIHDQLAHTDAAIKNLQWQLQQHPYSSEVTPYHYSGPFGVAQVVDHNGPVVAAEAIQHLQDDMHHQQSQIAGGVTHQLHNTVAAGVEAELAVKNVHQQQIGHGVYVSAAPGLRSGIFQSKLQKLINEHNEQEIENQINHHHHQAQQLHHQQEFVNQEKQQIEAQQIIVQHPNLEQAHHQLEVQEYHLIQEQLAHHLAILQLQQALVHKEHQILQDTVAEHLHGQAVHGTAQPLFQQHWSF